MSARNIIMGDWLALIRRVLGSTESGMGELVLITQFHFKLDKNAREMALQIRYHVCHYLKTCNSCGASFEENSESFEPIRVCLGCGSMDLKKHRHIIEVKHFSSFDEYLKWKHLGMVTYYKRYLVRDIERYFPYYNTLQWDNMFNKLGDD